MRWRSRRSDRLVVVALLQAIHERIKTLATQQEVDQLTKAVTALEKTLGATRSELHQLRTTIGNTPPPVGIAELVASVERLSAGVSAVQDEVAATSRVIAERQTPAVPSQPPTGTKAGHPGR